MSPSGLSSLNLSLLHIQSSQLEIFQYYLLRGYSKFRRHHLSVHTDPWHCDKCPAVFSEEAKLKVKMNKAHFVSDFICF